MKYFPVIFFNSSKPVCISHLQQLQLRPHLTPIFVLDSHTCLVATESTAEANYCSFCTESYFCGRRLHILFLWMSSDCFSSTRYCGWSIKETLNSIIFLGSLVISTLAFTSTTGDPLELQQSWSHFFASVSLWKSTAPLSSLKLDLWLLNIAWCTCLLRPQSLCHGPKISSRQRSWNWGACLVYFPVVSAVSHCLRLTA